jgi:hypothetical protein
VRKPSPAGEGQARDQDFLEHPLRRSGLCLPALLHLTPSAPAISASLSDERAAASASMISSSALAQFVAVGVRVSGRGVEVAVAVGVAVGAEGCS